ncbi:MAG: phosphoadenosine phosphosulfate reductase family protein [Methanomassiliicoccales archaeon]|nr:phosphoadenosine phosphosulfate reductase family protein [Methanomassiliicoccales archaeon]
MSLVRLGKLQLHWCPACHLPVLEDDACGRCSSPTAPVKVTPPGDIRPASGSDISLIRELADREFGPGTGLALIPDGEIVVMNKIPALDRMEEIIIDGEVVATLRYDIGKGYVLLVRTSAARRMQEVLTRGYVVAEDGALEFLLRGLNLMAPGVKEMHGEVRQGDEVIVLDTNRRAVCTGNARIGADHFTPGMKGMAIKCRWYAPPSASAANLPRRTWNDVLEANSRVMTRRVEEATSFIRDTVESTNLHAMVSFSGGKDSLATLLLTLDAGLRLPVLFIDTGLEFPETVEHVRSAAVRHGLELMVEKAPESAFFGNLAYFGPPGRDFRWCCKTNKLGPTVRAITERFPQGVLSFIGQRRYESESRADKQRVWHNPWTPGQVGASPIQDWTALHVWLYIMAKGEPYNEWYDKGLDRIGCYLCPASDLAELEIVAREFPGMAKWTGELERIRENNGFPREWATYGLWRWRRLPDSIRQELVSLGVDPETIKGGATKKDLEGRLSLRLQEGYSPCIIGLSTEGAFNHRIDLRRAVELLSQVGEVELNEEEGWCLALNVRVFEEGAIVAKGRDQEEIRKNVERVRRALVKAEECVGCGVCIARCNEGALTLKGGRLRVLTTLCIHCGRCVEPCPALSFGDSAFDL